MTFNLKKIKIGDAVEVTDYVANGSFASLKANVKYLDNSSPNKHAVLVRTLDFNRNWNGEYVWVDKAGFDFLKKSVLRKDDLVLCNVGSVGIVFEIPDLGFPMTLGPNSVLCRTKDVNLVRQKFLYYYFLSSAGQSLLQELSGGSTVQPKFNKTLLRNSEIEVPDLAHQDLVIKLLGSLDSKISLNETLSKTLADIAQTLFKSWFIDFDSVKAKMAGEKPAGMDAATAALFPDSMEETELGLIPSGWSWISVGEIARVIDCLHSKKPELLEEGFPYLQLDTISDSGVLRFENAGLISKEDYDKWTSRIEVQGGDCLITNVGRVGAVSQVPDHFKAAIGRNITALRPNDSRLHRSFLIVALLSDFMKKEIKRNTDSGTILEALNVKNIPKLSIPGPSNFVLQEFAKLCDPIQLLLHEIHEMNVNLKRIRDSLLPRLISGELRIPDEMLAS
jgi:type I restriction enzyme S subunit